MRETPEQLAFGEAFKLLPFEEQLRQFLLDVEHPPHYYPQWFVSRIAERLRQIPRRTRIGILWRLRGRKHGPWKNLKRKIARRYCERARRGQIAWPWDNGKL